MVLTRLIVLLFQFSVSLSSEMQFGVIHLETGQTTLICILDTLISLLFVYIRITYTAPNSLPFKSQLAFGIVFLVGWWMEFVFFLPCGLSSWYPLLLFC